MEKKNLSPAQREALELAEKHTFVVIGKGYGRDVHTENAIAAGTWKSLVIAGLLTPREDRKPFTGEALRVESGRVAYLTEAGKARLAELRAAAPSA